jgi:predicted  nucleic acid-binding Zn-ribbon protein
MSLITDIRTLQEIDDEAASLEAALADLDARLAASAPLQAAEEAFAAADARYQQLRRSQRELEASIADLNARIQPEERRLYDGSVRNPKELTAIQHELELLQAQRSQLEDRLLEVMEQFEEATAARAGAETRLAEARAVRAEELEHLHRRREELAARLAEARSRREALAATIPPPQLRLYDEIRRRRGQAVARIQGSSCTGCRVTIPESVRRKAFDPASLAQCPNCERILYVG